MRPISGHMQYHAIPPKVGRPQGKRKTLRWSAEAGGSSYEGGRSENHVKCTDRHNFIEPKVAMSGMDSSWYKARLKIRFELGATWTISTARQGP